MTATASSWDDLKLAAELREAIAAAGWAAPTQVQAAAIPPMLRGSDVALQSRTGSGKTGGYVLPLLQRALLWQHAVAASGGSNNSGATSTKKQLSSAAAAAAASPPPPIFLVLVPSVELCAQTVAVFDKLGRFVRPRCQVVNIPARMNNSITGVGQHSSSSAAAVAPVDAPTASALVLVSTPAFLVKAVKIGVVPLETVLQRIAALVIDEADMLQSHTSMQFLYGLLPPTRQSVLLSATLTESVARLKGALLNQPVAVRVDEEAALKQQDDAAAAAEKKKDKKEGDENVDEDGDDEKKDGESANAGGDKSNNDDVEIRVVLPPEDRSKLRQHYLVATDECTKHTLLYSLFRLNGMLLPGKTLIFVDDDREPYRVQHFLEQLGISSLVYDLTLPVKARCEILQRYQEADMGVLICTDHTLHMAERLQAELGRQTEGASSATAAAAAAENGEDDDGEGKAADEDDLAAAGDAAGKKRKQQQQQQTQKKQKAAAAAASEPGLSRGIDFHNVGNVILFQGVKTISDEAFTNYLHRVGRTARAGHAGQSIALFTVTEAKTLIGPLRDFLRERRGEQLRPFKKLDRSQAAALQYRVQAAVQNVTRHAAKKLRVASVAAEMGRSSYLSTRLNSADTGVLRRLMKGATKQVRGDKNLREVPEYMGLGKRADDRDHFEQRVNAEHLTAGVSRERLFRSAAAATGGAAGAAASSSTHKHDPNKKRTRSEGGGSGSGRSAGADPLAVVAARVAARKRPSSMKRRKVDPTDS